MPVIIPDQIVWAACSLPEDGLVSFFPAGVNRSGIEEVRWFESGLRGLFGLTFIVACLSFCLCRLHIANRRQRAMMVESARPFKGRQFHCLNTSVPFHM